MAFGLFEHPHEPPVTDVAEDRFDQDLTQETKAKIEDMTAFNNWLVDPTKMQKGAKTSAYDAFLTKELKTSYIERGDTQTIDIMRMGKSLLDQAIFLKLPVACEVINSERQDALAISSSVDGFERKSLISTFSNIVKKLSSSDAPKKMI